PPAEHEIACRRTLREARAIAGLSHPNVVTLYDVLDSDDRPWIVMELLRARSLGEVLAQDGPLPVARVATIGLAVLGALEAAHDADIVHRDIKPGNILLLDDGRVKLTDFGIARAVGDDTITGTGLLVGSPSYIAPEIIKGQEAGAPADLWGLGATLYASVEGRAPFSGGDAMETLAKVVQDPPTPYVRAGALIPALDAMLEKDPLKRAKPVEARRALLDVLRGGNDTEAPPAGPRAVSSPSLGRTPAPGPEPAPAPPAPSGPALADLLVPVYRQGEPRDGAPGNGGGTSAAPAAAAARDAGRNGAAAGVPAGAAAAAGAGAVALRRSGEAAEDSVEAPSTPAVQPAAAEQAGPTAPAPAAPAAPAASAPAAPDAGPRDARTRDAGRPDPVLPDSGRADSVLPDSVLPDSVLPDSVLPDSGRADEADEVPEELAPVELGPVEMPPAEESVASTPVAEQGREALADDADLLDPDVADPDLVEDDFDGDTRTDLGLPPEPSAAATAPPPASVSPANASTSRAGGPAEAAASRAAGSRAGGPPADAPLIGRAVAPVDDGQHAGDIADEPVTGPRPDIDSEPTVTIPVPTRRPPAAPRPPAYGAYGSGTTAESELPTQMIAPLPFGRPQGTSAEQQPARAFRAHTPASPLDFQGERPRADRRKRSLAALLIVIALIAVVVVGGALLLTSMRGGGGGDDQAGNPTTSASLGPATIPSGYTQYAGSGFSVAVPTGWPSQAQRNGVVDIKEQNSTRFLRLITVDNTASAFSQLGAAEKQFAANPSYQQYQRVKLARVDYRGLDAADWEFTFTLDGVPRHVLYRGIVSGDRTYGLYLSTPAANWDKSKDVFQVAADTFRTS
ncbi:MAG TPA: protein kinase, partial [Mycobacteriales bacterium]|nr:protein kinase [Mycobacteriales bacterium]